MMEKNNVNIEKINFGPDERILEDLLNRIVNAKKEIYLMHFWFTWKPVADALIKAKRNGVRVNILVDKRSLIRMESKEKTYKYSTLKFLKKYGINNINIYSGVLFHHKVVLIDESFVIFGSLNLYRGSILEHCENLIAIRSKLLYNSFRNEFEKIAEIQSIPIENEILLQKILNNGRTRFSLKNIIILILNFIIKKLRG